VSERPVFDPHHDVLDRQLVDVNGTFCGIVDALEFTPTPQGPVLTALWVGPDGWLPRVPALLALLCERVVRRHHVSVPWRHVREVSEVIRLDVSAGALGLGRADRAAARWISKLPFS
jgi:hypothetical protein